MAPTPYSETELASNPDSGVQGGGNDCGISAIRPLLTSALCRRRPKEMCDDGRLCGKPVGYRAIGQDRFDSGSRRRPVREANDVVARERRGHARPQACSRVYESIGIVAKFSHRRRAWGEKSENRASRGGGDSGQSRRSASMSGRPAPDRENQSPDIGGM